MKITLRLIIFSIFMLLSLVALVWMYRPIQAQADAPLMVAGEVFDSQFQPVKGATVSLKNAINQDIISQVVTQPNGVYALELTGSVPSELILEFERSHFELLVAPLQTEEVQKLRSGNSVIMPDLIMERMVSMAFWVAAFIFILVLVFIATGKLHNTLSALLGASLIYFISYLGEPINHELFVFNFQQSLTYIDWNVIFLIMGMMIIIAVVENTGIFQWMPNFLAPHP